MVTLWVFLSGKSKVFVSTLPPPVITVFVSELPVNSAFTINDELAVSVCPFVSIVTLLAPPVPVLIVEIVMSASRTTVTSVFPVKLAVSPVPG